MSKAETKWVTAQACCGRECICMHVCKIPLKRGNILNSIDQFSLREKSYCHSEWNTSTNALLNPHYNAVHPFPREASLLLPASVLQMWHCCLSPILEGTSYGYHSVKSILPHTFYYQLNMHSNILFLSQLGMNFSDWRGLYKSYKNTVFLFIVPFPLSHTSNPWKQKEWKTIANISYCLKEKQKKRGRGMQNQLVLWTDNIKLNAVFNYTDENCTCTTGWEWQLLPSSIKKHALSYGKLTLLQMLGCKPLYNIFEHMQLLLHTLNKGKF